MLLLRPFRFLAARLGLLLLALKEPLAVYGLYLVFKYGTEAQAQKILDAAVAERNARRPVLLVPVITRPDGVPAAPAPKGGDLVN